MSVTTPANRLLASLSPESYDTIAPRLERRSLDLEQELSQLHVDTSVVYFPVAGVVSLIGSTEDGGSIECMLVGNEGMVGFWLALGITEAPWQSIVQAEGEALLMPRQVFLDVFERDRGFRSEVLSSCGALFVATSQSVVCNRFHDLTSRTARWLLLMHDRMMTDEFHLTHAFMGLMLGVHRPAVTVALRTLSEAGIIEQRARASLAVLDRGALEDAACECYARATGLPAGK